MLLGTLSASLLGNILAGKGAVVTNHKKRINKRAIATIHGRGIIRTGEGTKKSTKKVVEL